MRRLCGHHVRSCGLVDDFIDHVLTLPAPDETRRSSGGINYVRRRSAGEVAADPSRLRFANESPGSTLKRTIRILVCQLRQFPKRRQRGEQGLSSLEC